MTYGGSKTPKPKIKRLTLNEWQLRFGELVRWKGPDFDRRADRFDGMAGT